jgi:superfamily II DNA/RNA helicase
LQVASELDLDNRISKQYLRNSENDEMGNNESVLVSSRIRWGAVDLVVSTPSKFVDDMTRFEANNLKPSTIVFDEADWLFHGASQGHVLDIIKYLRPRIKGQTDMTPQKLTQFIFASATLPDMGQLSIGSMITQRFPTAAVIRSGNFHGIPSSITMEWMEEAEGDWQERCFLLTNFLAQLRELEKRVIVFVNSTRNCELLFRFLAEKKWPVFKYTKNCLDDKERFVSRNNDLQILVATDLAARGIDWNDVDVVVNFQMPRDVVTWIHRAGRCGRMGRKGRVITMFKKSEHQIVDGIKARLDCSVMQENKKVVRDLSPLFSRNRSLRKKIRLANTRRLEAVS